MARSKYSKQPKTWMQYAIQPSLPNPDSKGEVGSKIIAVHSNLQHEAFFRPSYDNYMKLAYAFYTSGYLVQAAENYQHAIVFDSESSHAKLNLAITLEALGRFDEAHQSYVEVIHLNSDHKVGAFENLMAFQDVRYPLDMALRMEILTLYRKYFVQQSFDRVNTGCSELGLHSPLRVGFVSADLRYHPVGFFLESTLAQFDIDSELSGRLELIAYHNQDIQDDVTFRLSEYFTQWYRVNGWSDERLATQIQQDRIDILIDLSGYTRGNRLPVFNKKVAPLQVSWLGYWGSTGLSAIDYVLADPISVPVDEEHWFVEKVWRLPHLRYCFSIPEDATDVIPPPCIDSQKFVFGCYQELKKINQGVLQCWRRILDACPNARLRIQSKELTNADIKKQFHASLLALGLDLSRIDLVGSMERDAYLASYAQVDILLDTFPYPGGTTTAEALWMGVPTITLALPSMLGRQGEALMVNAGLPEWVVQNEEEYVQKAIGWANAPREQRESLATLRGTMREQVRQSPVFNARQFAHEFVDALYGMWNEKCGN